MNSLNKFTICLFFFLGTVLTYGQSTKTANSIIEKYQTASAIDDLQSTITYKNISKKGRVQERSLEQFILQKDASSNTYNFLLKFVSPADISGTSSLTIQHDGKADDQWLYLPALRKAKRISASKKGDRFMGTEMTYEDLSNYLSEPMEEYNYELVGEENVMQKDCYKIIATPLAGTKTQYSKRILWIDQATSLQVQSHFYNKKDKLQKVLTAKDIIKISDTNFYKAHFIQIENLLTKNRTEVYYDGFVINKGVNQNIFSKSYIETL